MQVALPGDIQTQAARLLDFSTKLDINLLDMIVRCMYESQSPAHNTAKQVLEMFRIHPDAWTRVDAILKYSQQKETKFFALQILEEMIKVKWKVLLKEQAQGIKDYILGLITTIAKDAQLLEREKTYVFKLNMVLVQILKHDWPHQWPTFIPDILAACRGNESICLNSMQILELFSEEVFDCSSGQMTQAKSKIMKDTLCAEFSQVFELCQFVLENSQNPSLLLATLKTMQRFMNWVPLGYIFETCLISILVYKFFIVPAFQNITLQCLSEIACISNSMYDDQFLSLFQSTMAQLKQILPLSMDLKKEYTNGSDEDQRVVQNLALFLSTFLKEHGMLLESRNQHALLHDGLSYLLIITGVEDVEIFKISLEYWAHITCELHRDSIALDGTSHAKMQRKHLYAGALHTLRCIMVCRMARPEEVIVVMNEQGEAVRQVMMDTDSLELYNLCREVLVFLCHLDVADTEKVMCTKLARQLDGTEWSLKSLNPLCWAIGSISGAMDEEVERRFLVCIIRELLSLCEAKKGKDNKALISSNIMYVVGQHPRFLRAHWRFLKTVVLKLMEFMHEHHEGVQEMACDTFIKIAIKCKRHFIQVQYGETQPFIDEIIANIGSIVCELQPDQVQTFYEALGHMITAALDRQQQERLVKAAMCIPNSHWELMVTSIVENPNYLTDQDLLKRLYNILKTNTAICRSVGQNYVVQLKDFFLDLMHIYQLISKNMCDAIVREGESVTNCGLFKSMRSVKKETLHLISTWIGKCNSKHEVLEIFLPRLIGFVLVDYNNNPPQARDVEVLSTVISLITKMEEEVASQIPIILDSLFECTLAMISQNLEDYPEHRIQFYNLIRAVVSHCFIAIVKLGPAPLKVIMDSLFYALKHQSKDVADIGFTTLIRLVSTMEQTPEFAHGFFQAYFILILDHTLAAVTQSSQRAGLTKHATLLAQLCVITEVPGFLPPLSDTAQLSGSNEIFVKEHLAQVLAQAFPHLLPIQIKLLIQGCFDLNNDIAQLKEHLRDFLVQIRVLSGGNTDDLYLEEREAELRKVQEEKRKFQSTVSGLLKPYEVTFDNLD